RRALAQGLYERSALFDRLVDLGTMVEVVGESGVNVGERQIVFRGDLVRALAHPLVPDRDVLHGDAMPSDARLAAGDPRRHLYVLIQRPYRHFYPPSPGTDLCYSSRVAIMPEEREFSSGRMPRARVVA